MLKMVNFLDVCCMHLVSFQLPADSTIAVKPRKPHGHGWLRWGGTLGSLGKGMLRSCVPEKWSKYRWEHGLPLFSKCYWSHVYMLKFDHVYILKFNHVYMLSYSYLAATRVYIWYMLSYDHILLLYLYWNNYLMAWKNLQIKK